MTEPDISVNTIQGPEGSFIDVFIHYMHLVIQKSQMNLGKYLFPSCLIKEIVYPQQWVPILNGVFIQLLKIHAQPQRAILLSHKQCGRSLG